MRGGNSRSLLIIMIIIPITPIKKGVGSIPFRITNKTTGKKVLLQHIDRGINGASGSNEDPGYGDCEYTRNERVKFSETGVDLSDLEAEYKFYKLSFDWLIQSDEDNAIYPWSTDDSLTIITRKMLHDGDSTFTNDDKALFNNNIIRLLCEKKIIVNYYEYIHNRQIKQTAVDCELY